MIKKSKHQRAHLRRVAPCAAHIFFWPFKVISTKNDENFSLFRSYLCIRVDQKVFLFGFDQLLIRSHCAKEITDLVLSVRSKQGRSQKNFNFFCMQETYKTKLELCCGQNSGRSF